jgi:hypothetical protein
MRIKENTKTILNNSLTKYVSIHAYIIYNYLWNSKTKTSPLIHPAKIYFYFINNQTRREEIDHVQYVKSS